MVDEPVPDQSSPMETDIIPDDNKLGLLWPIMNYCFMKCVQKVNNEGCVVGTEDGVVMQDSLYTDGCTQGDISSTLTRDMHYGPLPNNVSAPTSGFRQVEPSLIYKNKLMLLWSCIKFQESLKQKNVDNVQ